MPAGSPGAAVGASRGPGRGTVTHHRVLWGLPQMPDDRRCGYPVRTGEIHQGENKDEACHLDGTGLGLRRGDRSEEHTSELQSLMRISYAVFCLKKKKYKIIHTSKQPHTTIIINMSPIVLDDGQHQQIQ